MTTTKQYQLPREFAEKWVKALRSGEYKQATTRLMHNGGYCCLGVGAKVCGADDAELLEADGSSACYLLPSYNCGFPLLKRQTKELIPELLFGLPADNEFVKNVATMNDERRPFPEIADWIEENVEFV